MGKLEKYSNFLLSRSQTLWKYQIGRYRQVLSWCVKFSKYENFNLSNKDKSKFSNLYLGSRVLNGNDCIQRKKEVNLRQIWSTILNGRRFGIVWLLTWTGVLNVFNPIGVFIHTECLALTDYQLQFDTNLCACHWAVRNFSGSHDVTNQKQEWNLSKVWKVS